MSLSSIPPSTASSPHGGRFLCSLHFITDPADTSRLLIAAILGEHRLDHRDAPATCGPDARCCYLNEWKGPTCEERSLAIEPAILLRI